MNFLNDDEFLLLMNLGTNQLQGTPTLSIPERVRLREAGIQTAIEYPQWNEIEPSKGSYNFSSIENILGMNRSAGMKTIFALINPWIPDWIPNEWRLRYSNGTYNTASFSPWNEGAIAYERNFMKMLIDKYTAPDVMFILQEHDTGESAFPSSAWYDDFAVQDFRIKYGNDARPDFKNEETKQWLEDAIIKHFIELQQVFYPPYKEIWNSLQWLIAQLNPESMNYIQPKILQRFLDVFPDVNIVLLQYTYFDGSHPPENAVYVDMLKEKYCKDVIVEAMFCKGLKTTTPKAIQKGFRGQIICPTHPHTQEKSLQDWMINEIRISHNLWRSNKI
jgi:hypothetical protein